MNKKYIKYIEYIVNDIEPPYFKNMEYHYGLKEEEYKLVLSKVYNQPVTIKGYNVYDTDGNVIYFEDSSGFWEKWEFDANGNRIYYENSDGDWVKYGYDTNGNRIYHEYSSGFWEKWEYDTNGNVIYYEDSDGEWAKYEYDTNNNRIYFEDSDGEIEDNR